MERGLCFGFAQIVIDDGAAYMKLDRSIVYKFRHIHTYKYLINLFIFNILYIFYSLLSNLYRNDEEIIGFAYRYFNGNIKYLYEEMTRNYKNIKIYFVTDDLEELKTLKESGVESYYHRDIKKIPIFVKTKVWVTSHGPFYIPEYYLFSLSKKHKSKWVDTSHGIEVLEGTGERQARLVKNYDLSFISSEFFRKYYSSKEDGILDKLKLTGFARTDPLLNDSFNREDVLKELGIPPNRKNVLYAPTWGKPMSGEDKNKPFFPFESDKKILDDMDDFCKKNGCNFILRMHPNWERDANESANKTMAYVKKSEHIFYLPFEKYPITEPILYISDVLATDHSSIANDFILLDRPIIYLDIGIGEERHVFKLTERGGDVVKNKIEFLDVLQNILNSPEQYQEIFRDNRREYINKIYKYTDGNSSKRCIEEILKLFD